MPVYLVASPFGNLMTYEIIRQLLELSATDSNDAKSESEVKEVEVTHVIWMYTISQSIGSNSNNSDDESQNGVVPTATSVEASLKEHLGAELKGKHYGATLHAIPFLFMGKTVDQCKQAASRAVATARELMDAGSEASIHRTIDGVFLNFHAAGVQAPWQKSPTTGMLQMAEWKMLGLSVLVSELLRNAESGGSGETPSILSPCCRFAIAGSEVARGFEKAGFPPPSLRPSDHPTSYFEQWLVGSRSDHDDEASERPRADIDANVQSNTTWKLLYCHLHGIVALYVAALPRKYPQHFFTLIAPGLTRESLKASNAPTFTLGEHIMCALSWHYFSALVSRGIGIEMSNSMRRFVNAMQHGDVNTKPAVAAGSEDHADTNGKASDPVDSWPFPSGALVGGAGERASNAGLAIQSNVRNGEYLNDQKLQDGVFAFVQKIIEVDCA